MVIIEMENGGKIKIELDRAAAPNTVKNFLSLVNKGFYNGLMGGPGYSIRGEFSSNGIPNPIKHKRGVVSMARAMNPNSAGSQFFIMHEDAPHLDGQYAAFGKVVEGMDVVDKIAAAPTDRRDRPIDEQRIKSITIVDEGQIEEPEKI